MAKRIFTIWLLICTFGYGVAWAYDAHELLPHDSFSSHDQSNTVVPDTDDDAHNSAQCDHCCHASAHIIGFTCASEYGNFYSGKQLTASYDYSVLSYIPPPEGHPPTA